MINVLLVDDEALTLELHRSFLERLEGFRVVGECTGARAAVTAILEHPPAEGIDLILLDMTMPDGTGLDVLRHIRAHASDVDVIAVTAVRDAEVVRQMASLGVAQYLVKPFAFGVFRERLEQYREFRRKARDSAGQATQSEIDALLGAMRPVGIRGAAEGAVRREPRARERRGARRRTAVGERGRRAARDVAGRRPPLPRAPRRSGTRRALGTLRRTGHGPNPSTAGAADRSGCRRRRRPPTAVASPRQDGGMAEPSDDWTGYDADFLGIPVPLPTPLGDHRGARTRRIRGSQC